MPTLRRSGREGNLATRPGRPEILLTSESPYGSRRLVVEYDGVTTAAYVYDQTAVIAAVWLANHQPAPAAADPAQVEAGQAPVMPAGHTRHPGGRPPLDSRILRPLWFEEGDGVALVEGGRLLAVIPGWSDMSRGMPGYSRECIGQTPFAWSRMTPWKAVARSARGPSPSMASSRDHANGVWPMHSRL
jgi:hypothetical protein